MDTETTRGVRHGPHSFKDNHLYSECRQSWLCKFFIFLWNYPGYFGSQSLQFSIHILFSFKLRWVQPKDRRTSLPDI